MNDFLCFIKLIGEENNGDYIYEFFFSDDINNFDVDEDNNPCCLSNEIKPKQYSSVHIVKTKIKFDLIQNNCCFSFKHAKLRIVALAFENIDAYEEYPENGRLVFMFGDSEEDVEKNLAAKNILIG